MLGVCLRAHSRSIENVLTLRLAMNSFKVSIKRTALPGSCLLLFQCFSGRVLQGNGKEPTWNAQTATTRKQTHSKGGWGVQGMHMNCRLYQRKTGLKFLLLGSPFRLPLISKLLCPGLRPGALRDCRRGGEIGNRIAQIDPKNSHVPKV